MNKYQIDIRQMKGSRIASAICILNTHLSEVMHMDVVMNGDILNLFEDFKIPIRGTAIEISTGHSSLVALKNLGYQIKEL